MIRTKRAAREAGFTLIEVAAVLVIVALVASLAITMTRGTGRAGLHAVALETAALLRRERLGAVLTGRARDVSLDAERRALIGAGGEAVALPSDVMLDVLGVDAVWGGRVAIARFHPDGSSTGAVLKLSRENTEYEVRVNWYTGGVAIRPE
jgi:general secretion pathway protein H